jgi:predicted ATPase
MAAAISLAKELKDMHALTHSLWNAGFLAHFERNPMQVERCASELIELSTSQNFASWLAVAKVVRGWARSVSGDTAEGIAWIEHGIENMRAAGWTLCLPYALSVKAEAMHLADRASEALQTLREAEALAEAHEERWWCAELHRLRGVFLTALGADLTQIEASFCEAVRIFTSGARRSNLRRISPKKERIKGGAVAAVAKSFDGFVKSRCLSQSIRISLGMPRVQLRKIISQITLSTSSDPLLPIITP